MAEISIKDQQGLQAGWTWRTRHGDLVQPRSMETRHLFFTLRMIWHNSMPRDAWVINNPKLYTFGPSYSESYLMDAIRHLSAELSARKDMTKTWADQLRLMIGYFETKVYSPVLVQA